MWLWDLQVSLARTTGQWRTVTNACLSPTFDWRRVDAESIKAALPRIVDLVCRDHLAKGGGEGSRLGDLIATLERMPERIGADGPIAVASALQAYDLMSIWTAAHRATRQGDGSGPQPRDQSDVSLQALDDATDRAGALAARTLSAGLRRGVVTSAQITANGRLFLRAEFDWSQVRSHDATTAISAMVAAVGDAWRAPGDAPTADPGGYRALRLAVDRLVRAWGGNPPIAASLATEADRLVQDRVRAAAGAAQSGAEETPAQRALGAAAGQIFATHFDASLRAGTLPQGQIQAGFEYFVGAMAWRWLKGAEIPGHDVLRDRQPFDGLLPLIEETARRYPESRREVLAGAIEALASATGNARVQSGAMPPRVHELVAAATLLTLRHLDVAFPDGAGPVQRATLAVNLRHLAGWVCQRQVNLTADLAAPLLRLGETLKAGVDEVVGPVLEDLHLRIAAGPSPAGRTQPARRMPGTPFPSAAPADTFLPALTRVVLYLDLCFHRIGPGYPAQTHVVAAAKILPNHDASLIEMALIDEMVLRENGAAARGFLLQFWNRRSGWLGEVVPVLSQPGVTYTVSSTGDVEYMPPDGRQMN